MEKHFVTFCSPGPFVREQTTKEIESWNIMQAQEMARTIITYHDVTPYGFYFTTRGRSEDELDSKETARSGMYYLGGEVLTLDEVKDRNYPNDRKLISIMESNGWGRIIVNTNSWKVTAPFTEDDVVLYS